MRLIRGLGETAAKRISTSRDQQGPFHDVATMARRAGLDRSHLRALADAGALSSLGGHRHQAWWQVLGVEANGPLLEQAPHQDTLIHCLPRPRPMISSVTIAAWG